MKTLAGQKWEELFSDNPNKSIEWVFKGYEVKFGDIVKHYDVATDSLVIEPFPFKNAKNVNHLDWSCFEVIK